MYLQLYLLLCKDSFAATMHSVVLSVLVSLLFPLKPPDVPIAETQKFWDKHQNPEVSILIAYAENPDPDEY
ncbi:hypothetical protein D3C79_1001130 [compost metagenome]